MSLKFAKTVDLQVFFTAPLKKKKKGNQATATVRITLQCVSLSNQHFDLNLHTTRSQLHFDKTGWQRKLMSWAENVTGRKTSANS